MLGHFGFSYVGLIYLLMLFLPNMLWSRRKPEGYTSKGENRILGILEQTGQVLTTCCALIFSDFNINPSAGWRNVWLFISFLIMLLYEYCWVRYFRQPTMANFYRRMAGIPVPLALLPIAAFLLLGIYGNVIWMLISTLILGIGHIGIHMNHAKETGVL
ncbi:hypothetical protein [Anaerolentibacter hominis]|uniref:hypothetical protein n=1 Tax=Anaerolentibacter hominis TaxID=3079009 RepID=UPI0031B89476